MEKISRDDVAELIFENEEKPMKAEILESSGQYSNIKIVIESVSGEDWKSYINRIVETQLYLREAIMPIAEASVKKAHDTATESVTKCGICGNPANMNQNKKTEKSPDWICPDCKASGWNSKFADGKMSWKAYDPDWKNKNAKN